MDTVWLSEALGLHITSQMGGCGQEGTTYPESLRELIEVARTDPSLKLPSIFPTQPEAKRSGLCDWPSLPGTVCANLSCLGQGVGKEYVQALPLSPDPLPLFSEQETPDHFKRSLDQACCRSKFGLGLGPCMSRYS